MSLRSHLNLHRIYLMRCVLGGLAAPKLCELERYVLVSEGELVEPVALQAG